MKFILEYAGFDGYSRLRAWLVIALRPKREYGIILRVLSGAFGKRLISVKSEKIMGIPDVQIPRRIWLEMLDPAERDACDVIIEMENGMMYTAVFVTLDYLRRQMDLSYEVSKQFPDTTPVRYVALDAPHVLVGNLERDTIEDTIDNLLALEVFEGFFTQVTEDETENAVTADKGKRATTEVAAVFISDVLSVESD